MIKPVWCEWCDPQDCPHSGICVCHQCDQFYGWYYRDHYPDCPWRVTEEETHDPHQEPERG